MATKSSVPDERSRSIERNPRGRVTGTSLDGPDPDMIAVLRGKTPAERLQIANEMWRFAFRMTRAQVEKTRPGTSAEDVSRETARRMANGSW